MEILHINQYICQIFDRKRLGMKFKEKQISIITLSFIIIISFHACKKNDNRVTTIVNNSHELIMAHVFEDSIRETDWLKSKSFSPSGAAANYSFLYILYRVLNDVNPASIIEFGMGQTSKMTSQYAAYKNPRSHLYLVEDDETWIRLFSRNIPESGNIQILHLPLEHVSFSGYETTRYKGLVNAVGNRKFDLIILDGPKGTRRYSRTNILDLMGKNLSASFVLIIDDCTRKGEQDTINMVRDMLKKKKIRYGVAHYSGSKTQMLIYSKDYSFLKTL
jgi:hypothetical protein